MKIRTNVRAGTASSQRCAPRCAPSDRCSGGGGGGGGVQLYDYMY